MYKKIEKLLLIVLILTGIVGIICGINENRIELISVGAYDCIVAVVLYNFISRIEKLEKERNILIQKLEENNNG